MQKKNSTRQLTKRETADLKRWGDEFGRGLHKFASEAYDAALDYYSKHYNDPAALADFNYDAGLEKSEAGLAAHVIAILGHERTPVALYNAVADWASNAIQIKDSRGETLLDRWREAPETIEACISWDNERDDLKIIAEETTARVAGGAQ
jgi:hypothetical protein